MAWLERSPFLRPRADARWFTWVVSAFLATLLFIVALVLAVNPYQVYGVSLCKPAYISAHTYQMLPGLLRREHYDTLIVGSCMAQNFRISHMESVPGWGRVIKATAGGASGKAMERFISAAFDAGKVKHIFLLPDTPFTVGGGIFNLDDQILEYLYDDNVWNDYQYFLNWDVLTEALPRTVKANLGYKRFAPSLDRDRMFSWDYGDRPERYSENEVREGFERWHKELATIRDHAPEQADYFQKGFENRLLHHIRKRPDIRFTVCFAPYSSTFWYAMRAHGGLEHFLAARQDLLLQLLALPNVKLYELQGDPITTDLSRFSDPWHYNAGFNAWIIDAIKEGRGRLETEEDIAAAIEAIREISRPDYQPAWLRDMLPEN